jgi:hypothetical protein
MQHSFTGGMPACVACLVAVFACGALAAPSEQLDLRKTNASDLGLNFAGDNPTVESVDAVARLGIAGAKVGDTVRIDPADDGNIKLTFTRLKREHILLSPANGGWWPSIARQIGFTPDAPPVVGEHILLCSGTIGDPDALQKLGGKITAQRVELWGPKFGSVPAEKLPAYMRDRKTPAGAWVLVPMTVQVEKNIGFNVLGDDTDEKALAANCKRIGIALDDLRVPGFGDRSKAAPGFGDRGKTVLCGNVEDQRALAVLGIRAPGFGDRAHLLKQKDGWKLCLLSLAKEQPLVIPVDHGKTTLLRPAAER